MLYHLTMKFCPLSLPLWLATIWIVFWAGSITLFSGIIVSELFMPVPNCTLVITRAFGLESRGVLLMGVSTGNVRVVGFVRVLLAVAGVCD